MSKKKAMELVDSCRTPIRRKIMILAEEVAQRKEFVTAKGLQEALGYKDIDKLSQVSYHVRALWKAGALKDIGGERIRGAYQTHYVPSKAFQATMTDTVALDQIAEVIEGQQPHRLQAKTIVNILRATGRPVEA